jgi:hypothetical protein
MLDTPDNLERGGVMQRISETAVTRLKIGRFDVITAAPAAPHPAREVLAPARAVE